MSFIFQPFPQNSSGINSGNAFPLVPINKEQFYRNDLQCQFYFDDVLNKWLTTNFFNQSASLGSSTGYTNSEGFFVATPFDFDFGFYIESVEHSVLRTSGTWRTQLSYANNLVAGETIVSAQPDYSGAVSVWKKDVVIPANKIIPNTASIFRCSLIEVVAGAAIGGINIKYRLFGN